MVSQSGMIFLRQLVSGINIGDIIEKLAPSELLLISIDLQFLKEEVLEPIVGDSHVKPAHN